MNPITINIRTNGSLGISADDAARIRLVDQEGREIPIPPGKGVSLCRCGASSNKPFCDKTHKILPFHGLLQGPVAIGRAVPPEPAEG